MATKEEAQALIERWEAKNQKKNDAGTSQILQFLRVWLDYRPKEAAELITEGKTPDDCYLTMHRKAKKKNQHSAGDAEAMEWILEYYGAKDPKGLIEGGLMYAVALDTAQRFKPYGTPDMAEHVPTTANPTALSEMEGTAPAQHKPASVTADDSLDALLDW